MNFQLHQLLRRTLLGVAALAAVIAIPAQAQITKAEGGTLCTSFSNISITPSGGISVTGCAGSTTGGGSGTSGAFSISASGSLALNASSSTAFTITRTGGSTGAVTVAFDRGGGCGPAPLTGDTVAFADGQTTGNLTIRTPNNDATCTVTLTGVTAGAGATAPTLGSPTMAYVLVGAGAGIPGGTGGGTGGGSTAAGSFSITATGSLAPGVTSPTTFSISRTGGAKGPVTVTFDRAGGCGPAPLTGDTVAFADGQSSANVTIRTPLNDATCTVTLKSVAAGSGSTATSAPAIVAPAMAYVLVGAGAGVPVITPPPGTGAFNCPAMPSDANNGLTLHYGGGIEGFLFLKSGQVGYAALPPFSAYGGAPQSGSTNVAASITTGSPSSGTVELSINHCPGVIDTNGSYTQGTTGGKCYISFPIDQSVHQLPWFENVGAVRTATDAAANQFGVCEAFASNGPWYVNVRYNYPATDRTYDMAWQLNWANFNP